jgi:hypothetical protein
MAVYDIGDKVRIDVTFTNSAATNVDPTEVTLRYLSRGGTVQTETYNGGLGDVQRGSLGYFYFDVDTTTFNSGKVLYKYTGTGAVVAAVNGSFALRTDVFDG